MRLTAVAALAHRLAALPQHPADALPSRPGRNISRPNSVTPLLYGTAAFIAPIESGCTRQAGIRPSRRLMALRWPQIGGPVWSSVEGRRWAERIVARAVSTRPLAWTREPEYRPCLRRLPGRQGQLRGRPADGGTRASGDAGCADRRSGEPCVPPP